MPGIPRSESTGRAIDAYKRGIRSSDIARDLGVSRQRIQQILARAGISCREAQHMRKAGKAALVIARREEACMAKWGVDCKASKELSENGLKAAYTSQRNAANQRGIDWHFNLAQWLEFWEKSGHLADRGRGIGGYCMARNKDEGPYAPWNVTIKTIQQNSSEGFTKLRPAKSAVGVFLLYAGTTRPWVARYGNKTIGRFATEAEASACVLEYRTANSLTDTTRGRGRGWTFVAKCKSRPYFMQCCGVRGYYATQAEAEAAYKAVSARRDAGESVTSIAMAMALSTTQAV